MIKLLTKALLLRWAIICAGLFVAVTAAAAAETVPAMDGAIDRLFSNIASNQPGVAIGVYREGRIVYSRGFGRADLENGAPITPQTVFHVASVSKQFTAFAVALLAAEGRLDLDADIRQTLPYMKDIGAPITARQLIHHTNGLRDQWELLLTRGRSLSDRLEQSEILNLAARQRETNFVPGSEYSYNNMGYTLLGEIVAHNSGQSFRDFTTDRMFVPLKMTNTHFNDDVTEIVPGRASSYRRMGDKWTRALLNYNTVGATSLLTTLDDMMTWIGNFDSAILGGPSVIKLIMTPGHLTDGTRIRYAFGLETGTMAGHPVIYHAGYDAGFRAMTAWFPKERVGIVLLRNDGGDPFTPTHAIADIVLNDGNGLGSPVPAEVPPTAEEMRRAIGHYASDFGKLIGVSRKDNRLSWRTAAGESLPLIKRSDGSFDLGLSQRIWSTYRFRIGAAGKTEIVETDSESGVQIVHRRVLRSSPTPNELEALAGRYYSPELDASYNLSVTNGKLVAHSLWLARPFIFEPSTIDRFDSSGYEMSTLMFERNRAGAATGFRVNVGNSRRIKFLRIAH